MGKSDWTVETLREDILAIVNSNDVKYRERFESSQEAITNALIANEKAITAALSAAKEAVAKAEASTERRFDAVGSAQESTEELQRNLIPRLEAIALIGVLEGKYTALDKDVRDLRESRSESSGGKATGREYIGYIIAIASIAMALIFHYVK